MNVHRLVERPPGSRAPRDHTAWSLILNGVTLENAVLNGFYYQFWFTDRATRDGMRKYLAHLGGEVAEMGMVAGEEALSTRALSITDSDRGARREVVW